MKEVKIKRGMYVMHKANNVVMKVCNISENYCWPRSEVVSESALCEWYTEDGFWMCEFFGINDLEIVNEGFLKGKEALEVEEGVYVMYKSFVLKATNIVRERYCSHVLGVMMAPTCHGMTLSNMIKSVRINVDDLSIINKEFFIAGEGVVCPTVFKRRLRIQGKGKT